MKGVRAALFELIFFFFFYFLMRKLQRIFSLPLKAFVRPVPASDENCTGQSGRVLECLWSTVEGILLSKDADIRLPSYSE